MSLLKVFESSKVIFATLLTITKIRISRKTGPNFLLLNRFKGMFRVEQRVLQTPKKNSVDFIGSLEVMYRMCSKSGIWIYNFRFLPKYFGWNPYTSKYFRLKNGQIVSKWGLGKEVKKYKLSVATNIILSPYYYPTNSLNLYRFKEIKKKSRAKHFDQVLNLMINGSNYFQHFILDALPFYFLSRNFLQNNVQVKILSEAPNQYFKNREFYLELFQISNNVIDLQDIQNISIKKMFYVDFKPHKVLYLNHSRIWNQIAEYINKIEIDREDRNIDYLTYIARSGETRNIINELQFIEFLQNLAKISNLKFMLIDPSIIEKKAIFKIMKFTKICFTVQGGSALNILGMPPKSILFELIPTTQTDTIGYMANGLLLNYIPIPIKFSKADHFFQIPNNVFEIGRAHV